MKNKINKKGFSLAEILMSLGILSIGMLLIAAVFPAGIHFTTIATERTIASSVADEAFAKIKMYCTDPCDLLDPAEVGEELGPFPTFVSSVSDGLSLEEFAYPSDADNVGFDRAMYFWSALWRRLGSDPTGRSIQVTVFVSRRTAAASQYYESDDITGPIETDSYYPRPVVVQIEQVGSFPSKELHIMDRSFTDRIDEWTFINPASVIVDGRYGGIYRVLERKADSTDPAPDIFDIIVLDRVWLGDTSEVWVVPPPVGGGRYPCIAVYQKVMRF